MLYLRQFAAMHCAWKAFVFSYSHIFKVIIIGNWFHLLPFPFSVSPTQWGPVVQFSWETDSFIFFLSTHLTNEGKFSRSMAYILCVFLYIIFSFVIMSIILVCLTYNLQHMFMQIYNFHFNENYICSSSFDLMYIVPHHWQLYNNSSHNGNTISIFVLAGVNTPGVYPFSEIQSE